MLQPDLWQLASWEKPAREATEASLQPRVHSASEKTSGAHGLYSYLSARLSLEGVKTAPRARRKPDPTGVGTRTITPPLLEDTGGSLPAVDHGTFRGVDSQLGEGSQTAVRVFRRMPNASENSSDVLRLKAGTGTEKGTT